MTLRDMMIVVHTLGGVSGFALGCLLLRPSSLGRAREPLLPAYVVVILVMVVALASAVAIGWGARSGSERATFGGLVLLGGYTAWRAWHAWAVRGRRTAGWSLTFVTDIGFTLITLFDGFVIVAALDLGAPGWAVGAVAVLGVVVGRWAIARVERAAAT